VSSDREIVCSRIVFIDSEFDAKKGRGERPGFPICICGIEIDEDGREIEHRLTTLYPERLPWDRGTPFATIGFALGAEAGSYMHAGYDPRSISMPNTWRFTIVRWCELQVVTANSQGRP